MKWTDTTDIAREARALYARSLQQLDALAYPLQLLAKDGGIRGMTPGRAYCDGGRARAQCASGRRTQWQVNASGRVAMAYGSRDGRPGARCFKC